ncbi:MAG: hypothetical protein SGCHY_004261 [Lobulomycetales sp.]
MIDDDTYLFLRNLEILLQDFSPDDDHYIGSGTLFMGCDNVRKYGDGPLFAHGIVTLFQPNISGGSGIVISRSAMRKMAEQSEKCIIKYKDCWAGDVRTALCMRDLGIKLKSTRHFNKDPPNAKFSFPADPCERPITFHHLLVKQIQRIYAASKKPTAKPADDRLFPDIFSGATTFGDIFQEFRGDYHLQSFMPNFNMPAKDYKSEPMENVHECQEACKLDLACVAWTFDVGKCWMKKNIKQTKEKPGASSGTFPEKYLCRQNSSGVEI